MEEMKNYYYFCITFAEFAIKTENYNIRIKKYIQTKNQIYFVSKLHINCVTIWRSLLNFYITTEKIKKTK